MTRRVLALTSSRADYGLLRPTLLAIKSHAALELELLVTGTHFSERHGYTIDEIIADGLSIDYQVDLNIDDLSDSTKDTTTTFSRALNRVGEILDIHKPDVLLVLGDRFEILAACTAALIAAVPVAHIHGGELTLGAIDDTIRHAITKIACVHFPVNEVYASRIRQLGESPDRIFTVDPLVQETIERFTPQDRPNLEARLGIRLLDPVIAVTYHPVTLNPARSIHELRELLAALESFPEATYVVTGTNADPHHQAHLSLLEEFVHLDSRRRVFVESLGHDTYLSLLMIATAVVGNSSSGVIEAPMVGTPSINIGARQDGRIHPDSVIDVQGDRRHILRAITSASSARLPRKRLRGTRPASQLITDVLARVELSSQKVFNDL
jgi:UDP-hydrolysing UDP-N-acetyl-D-glucosamine 2-epimerase